MADPTPSLTVEIESLKRAYAALGRGDVDGFVQDFDPEILRIEWEGFPNVGTFRGIDAVRAHVVQGRGTWAEGTCTPVEFVVAGDKVVLRVKVHVRLKEQPDRNGDKTDWITGEVGDVFVFRAGKAIEFRSFFEFQDAMRWAGAS
jgi:ketosteroid isomerase-like protein